MTVLSLVCPIACDIHILNSTLLLRHYNVRFCRLYYEARLEAEHAICAAHAVLASPPHPTRKSAFDEYAAKVHFRTPLDPEGTLQKYLVAV